MSDNSIYQFNVKKLNGEELNLSAYKDKVLLIVNTASQCGFTPQLKDLVTLKTEFSENGFEILAFPSNDFGGQEPLDGNAIVQFCESYGANFPIFEKIRVRGPYADPLPIKRITEC
jgi:glutathione peroxidase